MGRSEQPPDQFAPRPWRPRFGLTTLMLVMLVSCVMASAGYYVLRPKRAVGVLGSEVTPQALFVIFTLVSPMLLVVVLGLYRQIVQWLDRHSRDRP